jgi:hypothetical protein
VTVKNKMKTAKTHVIVVGLFLMGIMPGSVLLSQTPASTPIPSTDLSGNDRYPLPKEGLVPDKETAIKIAEAVLFRLYGENSIKGQRPYVVREDDYIWWISGTLPKDNFGNVFNIGISKHTAAVLRLTVGEDKLARGK